MSTDPRHADLALSLSERRRSAVEKPGGAGSAHILLVEDHPTNQLLAVELLVQIGCTVEIAHNGREAVELAARGEFAAILMDCSLPEMDGYEATILIRRQQRSLCRVPIIAVTSNTQSGDRERCLAVGMDDYMRKPLTVAELREALLRWCPAAVLPGLSRPFAYDTALERMGGNAELLSRVAASFLRTLPPMRDQVRLGIEERSGEVLEFAAHTLVGPLGMIAADKGVAAARQLESAAAAGDWPKIAQLRGELEAQLDLLVPALTDLAAKAGLAAVTP